MLVMLWGMIEEEEEEEEEEEDQGWLPSAPLDMKQNTTSID